MHIKFKLKNTASNHTAAIVSQSDATVYNVYFENVGNSKVSYSYYNTATPNIPKFINCVFDVGDSKMPNYTSTPTYTNCLFSAAPTEGTKTTCVTRPVTSADLDYSALGNDLKNKGTGTNVDGSQAHIGVFGGEYAWENGRSLVSNNRITAFSMDSYQSVIDQQNKTITFTVPEAQILNNRFVGMITELEADSDTIIFLVGGTEYPLRQGAQA